MNEKTPKNRHRYCFVEIFLFKTHLFILSRTSRNTYWIGDPFTQVKSAKHTVKSKTKSISSLGAFSNFSKTARSIYVFLKIPAWYWSGSCLFCYGAWAQKESAKLQNMRACTGKSGLSLGLSNTKLFWLIQIAEWSEDQIASHADVLRGSSRVPAPRTSADLSGQRRRPIAADYGIWEVHFGPWEISRLTL